MKDWTISVPSTLSSDTEPTVVVAFNSAKYVFNAGENTTRAILQSKTRWSKARALFLSAAGTQRASGVPGLLMTWADAGIDKVDIVGPRGLDHMLASMRLYTVRDALEVNTIEVPSALDASADPAPVYEDENVKVYAIPLLAGNAEGTSAVHVEPPAGTMGEDIAASLKRKREPSPPSTSKRANVGASDGSTSIPADVSPSAAPADTLRAKMAEADFTPSTLVGAEADAWRTLVIQRHMFPGLRAFIKRLDTPPQDQALRREGSGKARQQKQNPGKRKREPESGPNPPPSATDSHTAVDAVLAAAEGPPPPSASAATAAAAAKPSTAPPRPFRLPHPKGYLHKLPALGIAPSARPVLSYLLVGPRVRGKFLVDRAEALGVPKGRIRGQLAKGEAVTFEVDDGTGTGGKVKRVVTPAECLGPSEPPVGVLIMDVPTTTHIPPLAAAFKDIPFFAKTRNQGAEDRGEVSTRAVFHMCGPGVLEHIEYRAFMTGFPADVHHFVTSREHGADPVTFTSAAYNQLRLNALDADMFPLPVFNPTPRVELSSLSGLPQNTSLLRSNLVLDVRPPRAPTYDPSADAADAFHPAAAAALTAPTGVALPAPIRAAFDGAQGAVADDPRSARGEWATPGDKVRVIPLGTSSAMPTKYRNVSGTFVQIPRWGNVLLDAGEGTFGQMARFFGTDETREGNVGAALRELRCIFISHAHGDHHIGLAKILAMRKTLNPPPQDPLYLVANRPVHLALREYSELEDVGLHDDKAGVRTVLSDELHYLRARNAFFAKSRGEPWMDANLSQHHASELCSVLGLESLTTVDVDHRVRCFGVVLKHYDGWSLAYSGDTMPTTKLVSAAKNVTLLIHEATMADDQADMAKAKAHSTIGQAVDIGRQANAQNILLTHFSARYPKMPPTLFQADGPVTAVAFDHASLRIGDMWKMNKYLSAIEQNFGDTAEEGDEESDPKTEPW